MYFFKATEDRNKPQLIPNPNPIKKDVRKRKDRKQVESIFRIYPISLIRLSISLDKSMSLNDNT